MAARSQAAMGLFGRIVSLMPQTVTDATGSQFMADLVNAPLDPRANVRMFDTLLANGGIDANWLTGFAQQNARVNGQNGKIPPRVKN